MIKITYAEVDGTTKNETFDCRATTQMFRDGRTIVFLYDDDGQTQVGTVQYAKASRVANFKPGAEARLTKG